MSLIDLRAGFRDEAQLRLTQGVIMDRLADDREQDECRYLMRFLWQLSMTYREVTEAELHEHVGPAKLAAVEALVEAVRTSPEQVDAWNAWASSTFPFITDRGHEARRAAVSDPPATGWAG
jgi:hypothetical protein